MSVIWLFAVSVAAYSAGPLLVAAKRTRYQFVLLYSQIAAILVLGGLLGAVYVLPITGDIALLAGQVAYGAFMFTTLLTVVVGRDLQIIRNIIVLTVFVNALVFVLFWISQTAMSSSEVPNPLAVPAAMFEQSLRINIAGGILIVAELLLLLAVLEVAKRRVASAMMAPVYVLAFIGILTLDGVLFPSLVLLPPSGLGAFITAGVEAKFVLALAYAVPLVIFVALYRPVLRRFESTPLRMRGLLWGSRDELVESLESQEAELAETRRRLRRNDEHAARRADLLRRIASIDSSEDVEVQLLRLGTVLAEVSGVPDVPVTLAVEVEPGVFTYLGLVDPNAPVPTLAKLSRLPGSTVVEDRPLGPTVLLPLVPGQISGPSWRCGSGKVSAHGTARTWST